MRFWMFTFCALVHLPLYAAGEAYNLVDRWQVNFGRGQDHATYLTAACPDGTFYLSDNFGRVAVIDAAGKVTSRQLRREFAGAQALACDAKSRLYIAGRREIVIMQRGVMVSRMPTEVFITALAPASNGSVYACGNARASRLPLHLIDKDGNVVKSFGMDTRAPFNRMYPSAAGQILWQDEADRLLYIPKWRDFEIQAYSGDGRSLGVFGSQRPLILPVRIAEGDIVVGQSVGAAPLSNGALAIQREVLGWRPGLSSGMLEIYDSKLRRTGTAMSDARGLAGAAADGDLYFTTLSPRGLQVFRAGLVKRLAL